MFIGFVEALRRGGIPASLKEHLLFLEALDADVITSASSASSKSRCSFSDAGMPPRRSASTKPMNMIAPYPLVWRGANN